MGYASARPRAGRLARAGWFALALTWTGSARAQSGVYQEQGGLLVVEMESPAPGGDWSTETTHPGHTGAAYLRWDGGNNFSLPGEGTFGVEFDLHQAGHYELRIRNRHEHPDSTEENDCAKFEVALESP